MTLSSLVLGVFKEAGWQGQKVYYTAINRAVQERQKCFGEKISKSSTIERSVRKLAQQGFLVSDRKGFFMLTEPVLAGKVRGGLNG